MKIPLNIIDELISQAQLDAPNETCGYLLGTQNGDLEAEVTENYWMENIDHSPEHFSFSPREQFAALKYARQNGLKILANWHSHPASPLVHRKKTCDLPTTLQSDMPFSPSTRVFISTHLRFWMARLWIKRCICKLKIESWLAIAWWATANKIESWLALACWALAKKLIVDSWLSCIIV